MREQWNPARLTAPDPSPRLFAALALLVYAAAVLFVTLHHEPWRDEADVWLVARDASVPELFRWASHGGSPVLWYLLVKPLAAALPYISQNLLHVAVACGSAWLLLVLSPFTRVTRLLLLAGYYFSYEYAVISRPYAIGILLAFAAVAVDRKWPDRTLAFCTAVALLANTSVQAAVVAAGLGTVYLVRTRFSRRSLGGLLILTAGAAACWFQLRTPADAAFPGVIRKIDPQSILVALSSGILPGQPMAWAAPGAIAVLLAVLWAVRRSVPALLVLLLPGTGLALLFSLVWFGGFRHAGFYLLLTVIAVWLGGESASPRSAAVAGLALNLALVATLLFSFRMARADVHFAHSGGKEMGEYIRAHSLDRFEIAAHQPYAEAVAPYLPGKRFWYAGLGRYGTYLPWDRALLASERVDYAEAEARARAHFGRSGRPWLLLLNAEMPDPANRGFRLIYATRRPVYRRVDERFWLYAPADIGLP